MKLTTALHNALQDEAIAQRLQTTARYVIILVAAVWVASEWLWYQAQRGIRTGRVACNLVYNAGYISGKFIHQLNNGFTDVVVHQNPKQLHTLTQKVQQHIKILFQDFGMGCALFKEFMDTNPVVQNAINKTYATYNVINQKINEKEVTLQDLLSMIETV